MLRELVQSSWDSYITYGQRIYVEAKEIVYQENEKSSDGFYYLKDGLIRISATNHLREERIIDLVSSGKSFGEQAVDEEVYFSTATALVGSVVYFFPFDEMDVLLENDEQFRMLVYSSLTEKLELLSNNIMTQSLPTEKLLAMKLLTLKEMFKSNHIPFSQQELSRYTSLNRITIYNIFKRWTTDVVALSNRNITIYNSKVLKEIAAV